MTNWVDGGFNMHKVIISQFYLKEDYQTLLYIFFIKYVRFEKPQQILPHYQCAN